MQISIKGFITSKKGELYSDCRDNYSYNSTNHKFAISDGVSKSFFPGIWSHLLTTNYVSNHDDFVSKSQNEWLIEITDRVNRPDVKYYTRNAFNRKEPGLATFVGLQFFETDKIWSAQALGDSFLFFVPKVLQNFDEECIKLSSKPEPIEFDNFPDYYSSISSRHNGLSQYKEGKLTSGTFFLMTDALAEWFLLKKENAVKAISSWESQNAFQKFIELEREKGELGNDDSAILIIDLTTDDSTSLSYKEIKVSSITDLITKQEIEIIESVKAEQKLTEDSVKISDEEQEVAQEQTVHKEQPETYEIGSTLTLDCQNLRYNTNGKTSLLVRCSYAILRPFGYRPCKGSKKRTKSALQEIFPDTQINQVVSPPELPTNSELSKNEEISLNNFTSISEQPPQNEAVRSVFDKF